MTWAMAGSVVGFLRDLIVGRVSVKQLGGPIAITKASVNAARSGIEELFYLIALLSINVAILNLLPIPIARPPLQLRRYSLQQRYSLQRCSLP